MNLCTCLGCRYILKKKFDRGAYGEVWLAFSWNCSQVGKDSQKKFVEENGFYRNEQMSADDDNKDTNMTIEDCKGGNSDDMFILKRIMVHNQIHYLLSLRSDEMYMDILLVVGNFSPSLVIIWLILHFLILMCRLKEELLLT